MKLLCLKYVVARFILPALFMSRTLETRCVFQACLTLLLMLCFLHCLEDRRGLQKTEPVKLQKYYQNIHTTIQLCSSRKDHGSNSSKNYKALVFLDSNFQCYDWGQLGGRDAYLPFSLVCSGQEERMDRTIQPSVSLLHTSTLMSLF